MIILLILVTFSAGYVLILLGEIWCWSVLALKGFIKVTNTHEVWTSYEYLHNKPFHSLGDKNRALFLG